MNNIGKNLAAIHLQIEQASQDFKRDAREITLLAVSKKKPVEDIRLAYQSGQRDFGENYLQEAQSKMTQLADLEISWHFIGPIQSNKTKTLASSFDWVHCVERYKIAKRLSEQRPESMPPLNICIQVNLDQEPTKSGVRPEQVPDLAGAIADLPNVKLRGLMAIPAPRADFDAQRQPFKQLSELLQDLQPMNIDCDTLSMGMSHDMRAAIAEGSTILRIGTAIFGERI